MATVEVLLGVAGITNLKLRLFPRGDDTPANGAGDALAEQTNRRGCYRAVVDDTTLGLYEAYVIDAEGNLLYTGAVSLAGEGVYTVGELGDVPVSTRASETTVASIVQTVMGLVSAVAAIPAAVWSYSVRRLTEGVVGGSSVEQDENELTLLRGDTLAISFSGLGDISGRQKLWFTLKTKRADADADSQLLMEETAGLTVLAGNPPGDGETALFTIDDPATGDVTVNLSAGASKKLQPTTTGVWDLQVRDANGVRTLVQGVLTITADVTQAIE